MKLLLILKIFIKKIIKLNLAFLKRQVSGYPKFVEEFESTFSQKKALLGVEAIPPYAILAFLTLFFNISKLNAAQTDDISSSNLFETLYALKVFF